MPETPEDAETPMPAIPSEVAKKMPWWAWMLMTLAPIVVGTGSGYGGSLLGAKQQAEANTEEIVELKAAAAASAQEAKQAAKEMKEDLAEARKESNAKITELTKAQSDQNSKIERLTTVIALTSGIDPITLSPVGSP